MEMNVKGLKDNNEWLENLALEYLQEEGIFGDENEDYRKLTLTLEAGDGCVSGWLSRGEKYDKQDKEYLDLGDDWEECEDVEAKATIYVTWGSKEDEHERLAQSMDQALKGLIHNS